jgi:hypothetical protein
MVHYHACPVAADSGGKKIPQSPPQAALPSAMGALMANKCLPIPMKAERHKVVTCTAFCVFLERWHIVGFVGLMSEKLLVAVVCSSCKITK